MWGSPQRHTSDLIIIFTTIVFYDDCYGYCDSYVVGVDIVLDFSSSTIIIVIIIAIIVIIVVLSSSSCYHY